MEHLLYESRRKNEADHSSHGVTQNKGDGLVFVGGSLGELVAANQNPGGVERCRSLRSGNV